MPKKCYTHLSAEDRETLSLGLTHGQSLRMMARVLGRAPSTVSRELARKARRPRARGTDRRGQLPNMTPITERPAEVVARTVPGHWEGDLIRGARNGLAVGTLVERTTRLVILARMEGTDATSARQGFTKKLRHVSAVLRKTLKGCRAPHFPR